MPTDNKIALWHSIAGTVESLYRGNPSESERIDRITDYILRLLEWERGGRVGGIPSGYGLYRPTQAAVVTSRIDIEEG